MLNFSQLYTQVYQQGNLFGVEKIGKGNSFTSKDKRKNSIAVAGGALGDEGKGRVTDEITSYFLRKFKHVIHYRDNGGSNAGHNVAVGGKKLALHQIGSGILQEGCTVVMGKGMVLHPEDFATELVAVRRFTGGEVPAQLKIDGLSSLCLDTHRAFEVALKDREKGGRGSTGRGIAPAYADLIYRHPVRARDLAHDNWKETIGNHYQLYADLIKGLGRDIQEVTVSRLEGQAIPVGTKEEFLNRIEKARKTIKSYIQDLRNFILNNWESDTPFVFEKAQALGLDQRWGVYPDVTASDCSFTGIFASTEGVVDPDSIPVRAVTIKATYTSSVGRRKMPTPMPEKLAQRIREDADEYGATTGRPRDIVHIDLPMLSYLAKVSRATHLVLTHLDISYQESPIKVCVGYKKNNKLVPYRPDQEYLLDIEPEYVEVAPWDGSSLRNITQPSQLPDEVLKYIAFISKALNLDLLMVTVGPEREQSLFWANI